MAGAPPDIDDDPHGARLLAAVIDEPDEHARRLVYADWLLERGDPYGELIQLCERRFALGVQDPKLDARISLLQKPLLPRILRPLTTSHWPTIRRGFLWTVRFTAAEFAQHGEQLLARHPLHSLSIESSTKALAVLAQTPAVRRLSGLTLLSSNVGIWADPPPVSFRELCRSAQFDRLRRLQIIGARSETDTVADFARWEAPRLGALALHRVECAGELIEGLIHNDHIRLKNLRLWFHPWRYSRWSGPNLDWPAFAELRHLYLAGTRAQLQPLLDGVELPDLVALHIDRQAPVDQIRFPSLRRLHLPEPIDAATFLALLERHPNLAGLELRRVEPAKINHLLAAALELPNSNSLVRLVLPRDGADDDLYAAARHRFSRLLPRDLYWDWYA